MGKILLFVALAFAVWFLVRVLGASRRPRPSTPPPATAAGPVPIEGMVQCAWCGAHVPASSAVALTDGRRYCGAEHRDAATGARG